MSISDAHCPSGWLGKDRFDTVEKYQRLNLFYNGPHESLYIYIYIYIYTHPHTHTHVYIIYMYVYIYMYIHTHKYFYLWNLYNTF